MHMATNNNPTKTLHLFSRQISERTNTPKTSNRIKYDYCFSRSMYSFEGVATQCVHISINKKIRDDKSQR